MNWRAVVMVPNRGRLAITSEGDDVASLRQVLQVQETVPTRGGGTEQQTVGGFASIASLGNFTVAAFVVAILWQVVAAVPFLNNRNGAMASALLVGMALYFGTFNDDLSKPRQIGAFLVAVINCFVLYAAAIGIDVTFLGGTAKIQ
jgi:hypothetical protein